MASARAQPRAYDGHRVCTRNAIALSLIESTTRMSCEMEDTSNDTRMNPLYTRPCFHSARTSSSTSRRAGTVPRGQCR